MLLAALQAQLETERNMTNEDPALKGAEKQIVCAWPRSSSSSPLPMRALEAPRKWRLAAHTAVVACTSAATAPLGDLLRVLVVKRATRQP